MPVRNDFAPGEFCWVDLNAHDLEAAVGWYSEVFGWTHMKMEGPPGAPPYAFFTQGQAVVGGIGEMNDEMKSQGIPPMWNTYIATQDCAATEARVKKIGGVVTVPTMEVPGHGKLAFFRDPEGASFAAWQNTNADGPGLLVDEPVGVCWNELLSNDPEQARKFYGKLTGWKFANMPMGGVDYTMIKNAGKDAGGIMPMAGAPLDGIPPSWLVYFAVANCAETVAKVEANGGQVRVPPTKIPVGEFSVFSDPQGALFAGIKLTQPPK